jgi:hypothetical protein
LKKGEKMSNTTPTPISASTSISTSTSSSTSFDKLYKKIENAVKDLTMLKVVTAVGDVTITETVKKVDGEDQQTRAEQYLNAKAIVSTIDLVDGDIETIMDGVFASDNAAYNKIRDEHMLRIKDAHDIVGNNVKVLKELINTIRDILAARPVPETESITLKAE